MNLKMLGGSSVMPDPKDKGNGKPSFGGFKKAAKGKGKPFGKPSAACN